jgi:zinc/manganese transport system ATP-binding protein
MTAHIAFDDLTLGYDRHPAVHHLNTTLAEGSLTALVGPNGAGKSTLLKGIVGALKPLDGGVKTGTVAREDIAYLPQLAGVDRSFPAHVFDFVAMGLWRRIGAFCCVTGKMSIEIKAAIATVGLEGFEARPIGTLSGGQMQRALFARLLLQDARVILLDEPFTAIDSKTAADLQALIQRWHGERRTILAALHDLDEVRRHFPETLLLGRELIAHGPTPEILTPENLARARHLCEAFEDHVAACGRTASEMAA